MPYHDELLELALDVFAKRNPSQADLRRAVSTAYYALFHLLISEWTRELSRLRMRSALGRMFNHRQMWDVSDRYANPRSMPLTGEDPNYVSGLRFVAKALVESQAMRHIADYDNGRLWSPPEAAEMVETVAGAFLRWDKIRHTDIAQEYLVSLLIRPRD